MYPGPGHYPAGHPGLLYDPQLLEELYQRGLLEEAPAMGTVTTLYCFNLSWKRNFPKFFTCLALVGSLY